MAYNSKLLSYHQHFYSDLILNMSIVISDRDNPILEENFLENIFFTDANLPYSYIIIGTEPDIGFGKI